MSSGKSTFYLKKKIAARLRFAELHLNKPQDVWSMFVETFVRNTKKPNTSYQHKHLIPTVKHSGRGVMIWSRYAATVPGHLANSSTAQCEAFFPTARARSKLGNAAV